MALPAKSIFSISSSLSKRWVGYEVDTESMPVRPRRITPVHILLQVSFSRRRWVVSLNLWHHIRFMASKRNLFSSGIWMRQSSFSTHFWTDLSLTDSEQLVISIITVRSPACLSACMSVCLCVCLFVNSTTLSSFIRDLPVVIGIVNRNRNRKL